MALVLPVFLILVVGVLTYGISFATQQAVNYAADRGAEAVVAINPELDAAAFRTLAVERAERRIAGILAYFPGVSGDGLALSAGCGDDDGVDGEATKQSSLCVVSDGRLPGRRVVTVKLTPTFQSLWPGFPETGLIPTPEYIQATGTAVVPAPVANDGAG